MRPINVLSLFDGMSCGQLALREAGIPVARYFASEIDKHAIKVTQANFPDTVQLGDVTQINLDALPHIDLILAGSPCQGFSFAGAQLAFDDPRSKLFFDFIRILDYLEDKNPDVLFMLENVRMKKEFLDVITEHVGVDPIFLNSALVSAQNRERYYWANWKVKPPTDAGVVVADILETNPDPKYRHSEKAIAYMERGSPKWQQAGARRADRYTQDRHKEKTFTLTANMHKGVPYKYFKDDRGVVASIRGRRINPETKRRADYDKTLPIKQHVEFRYDGKSNCLTTVGKDNVVVPHTLDKRVPADEFYYRKLTPVECERLQTVPDNYTAHVSDTQRYKMLGNGWTVEMVAHILRSMPI